MTECSIEYSIWVLIGIVLGIGIRDIVSYVKQRKPKFNFKNNGGDRRDALNDNSIFVMDLFVPMGHKALKDITVWKRMLNSGEVPPDFKFGEKMAERFGFYYLHKNEVEKINICGDLPCEIDGERMIPFWIAMKIPNPGRFYRQDYYDKLFLSMKERNKKITK